MIRESDQPGLNLEAEGVPSNGNGHKNGNGRNGLTEELLPYNGFIATRATFLDRQPLREVRQELINNGERDPVTRFGVIREVYKAREEIRQERLKRYPGNVIMF